MKRTREEILQRANEGLALDLKELAEASGYCYRVVCQMKQDGLPLVFGKIRMTDFWKWANARYAGREEISPQEDSIASLVPASLRERIADKGG
jgi:hypothetical protein